jgi:hypothetical protein
VVVVGVDVRWLTGSLDEHYRGQFRAGSVVDPEEFLEKIFQVPFWIPAMNPNHRQNLLAAALPASVAAGATRSAAVPLPGAGATVAGSAAAGTTQEQPVVALPSPEPVTLSVEERAAILRWGALAGDTPRRLKRFARSYMILRAALPRDEREAFLVAGEYDTVARILAYGSAAPKLWPPTKPSDSAQLTLWNRFFGPDTAPPTDVAMNKWIPEIARFGFAEPKK